MTDPVHTKPPARAIRAPVTTQALQRSEEVTDDYGAGTVVVRRPSLIGAAIDKAAATRIPATAAERLRHEQDFLFLIELIGIVGPCGRGRASTTTHDGSHDSMPPPTACFADPTHQTWLSVTSERDVRTVIDFLVDTR